METYIGEIMAQLSDMSKSKEFILNIKGIEKYEFEIESPEDFWYFCDYSLIKNQEKIVEKKNATLRFDEIDRLVEGLKKLANGEINNFKFATYEPEFFLEINNADNTFKCLVEAGKKVNLLLQSKSLMKFALALEKEKKEIF